MSRQLTGAMGFAIINPYFRIVGAAHGMNAARPCGAQAGRALAN
jgi:hypothetical protein